MDDEAAAAGAFEVRGGALVSDRFVCQRRHRDLTIKVTVRSFPIEAAPGRRTGGDRAGVRGLVRTVGATSCSVREFQVARACVNHILGLAMQQRGSGTHLQPAFL